VGGVSGYNIVSYSTDGGNIWSSINTGDNLNFNKLTCIATNGEVIVVGGQGTDRNIAYASTSDPNSWRIGNIYDNALPAKIVWNPYSQKFIAAFNATTNLSTYVALYSSSDGNTWSTITAGATKNDNTRYDMYKVTDIACIGKYVIIIGGQALGVPLGVIEYNNTDTFILSADGGLTWGSPQNMHNSNNTATIIKARSVSPYYNDRWIVSGKSDYGGVLITSPLIASGTSWTTETPSSFSDCVGLVNNGAGWWLATVPRGLVPTDSILTTVGTDLMGGFSTVYSSLSGGPVRIVWSGKKFYYVGSGDILLYSSDGRAPWTRANISTVQITDITFTPPRITLTPSDAFERYFMTSSVGISGSLQVNEWVHLKNITSFQQEVRTTNSSVLLPPVTSFSPQNVDTPTAIVYSNGSSLTAV